MKRIFKYKLQVNDEVAVALPAGAEILSVQEQHTKLCLWALVDPAADTEQRVFAIVETGESFGYATPNYTYIATVQMMPFVWHVFEVSA